LNNEIEIRSEEVQELLGTTPPWMVRWGMLFALVLIIVTVWILYLFSYPETVLTDVQITRENPGSERNAIRSGTINSVLVNTEDTVVAGQTIAVFKSSADFADVHALDDYLSLIATGGDSMMVNFKIPTDLLLGAEDLNDSFYAFLERQKNAQNLSTGRLSKMSIDEINREISLESKRIQDDLSRIESLKNERILYEETYTYQDNLIKMGRGNLNEFRDAKANLLRINRFLQESQTSIKNRQATIRLLRSRLETTASISESEKAEAMRKLRDSFNSLRAEIASWRLEYLISSPINGVVILSDAAKAGAFVNIGERLAMVLPDSPSNLVGKASLNLDESGQVAEGQKVLIDFFSFPAQQYGLVEGVIEQKSKIPDNNNRLSLEIRFPDGLVTNTGRTLEVGQYMAGKMTIIIQEKRLIEWLLERF
jgi:hypothetical protein